MSRDFFHTGLQIGRSDIKTMLDGMGPGNHFYVDYRRGGDGNDGQNWENAFRTYSAAVAAVASNNNDVIHIAGDSEVIEAAMVTLSKNRVHTIGYNGIPGIMGQGARIACTATAGATNLASIKNTGVRNTFTGIKVSSAMIIAESLYAHIEAGEFTRYFNCSFYKSSDLDDAGAAELAMNGDTPMFHNCSFGSTVNETGDIRANVLLTGGIVSGKKCRDAYFEGCLFLAKADDTDKVMVYGANATDVERMLMMKDCTFYNTKLASGVPAHAVGFGAAQTEGSVILKDCASVNCTVMAQAAVGIYVAGAVPTFGTSGVSVAS
jgi:hypothetical protein